MEAAGRIWEPARGILEMLGPDRLRKPLDCQVEGLSHVWKIHGLDFVKIFARSGVAALGCPVYFESGSRNETREIEMTTYINYRETVTSADEFTRSLCREILDDSQADSDVREYAEFILTLPIKVDGKAAGFTTLKTSARVSGGMKSTSTKPANPADLIGATEKQINALINMGAKKLIGDAIIRHLTADIKVQDVVDRAVAGTIVTKGEASKALDFLFSAPWKPREAAPKQSTQKVSQVVTEDGMYRLGDRIVKVQKAVHGSGKLYAKELVGSKKEGFRFEYTPGLVMKLTAADRMSLEEAKAFGKLYGVCCVCSKTLTKEESIANGIGPVCGGNV